MAMIFKFEPHYFERVWGGQFLHTKLDRAIPQGIDVGESWDIVDRKDVQSSVTYPENGKLTIRDLLRSKHPEIMGPGWKKDQRFPLLVKWLDCRQRLSLQVHPPEELATSLKGEPKTENWYIADSSENAGVFIGLKQGTSKESFIQALEEDRIESVCQRIKSQTGDSILVESGSIHAIDGGNLILEIQQNSDTTYRVYDWGRKGTDGLPRLLHIKESLACINFQSFEPKIVREGSLPVQILADCKHFRIRKFKARKDQHLELKQSNEQCMILNPINSEISIGNTVIAPGELGLSPFNKSCKVTIKKAGDLIVTDNFYLPANKN